MARIIYGLYEQIINGIINENLNLIDQELVLKNTQPLDSAESSKILAEYLARILREILDYIDDSDTVVRDRVNFCNGILKYILDCISQGSFSFKKDAAVLKRVRSFLIQQDAQLLLSLVDKKSIKQTALQDSEKVIRPETPISENSLLDLGYASVKGTDPLIFRHKI